MAESLLFSLAESLIGKVASRAVEEASLALGVYDHLQDIKHTTSLIKAVLLDAEQKQQQNHQLREWLRQIKRVFNDAEDVIDDFECEALRKHVVNTSGSIGRKVRRYCSSSNPLVYRLKMAHKIKDIKERFNKVAADRLNFSLQINENDNRVVKRREMTHSHINESNVIGREHDKQKIIDLLLQEDGCDKSLSVIPIVGIGGLGKTTLAKCVFNDKSIVESFPLKMWVCISNDFELKHVLLKILNSASASNSIPIHQENFDVEKLQKHLRNKLVGQKFLLVLDDVWNEDRFKWEELKDIIQGVAGAEGSKVLVTTRSHTVANVMVTSSSHILQGLSREDSFTVFVKSAFKEGEVANYPELEKIGEEIAKKCGGLPLALRTLGSSLFSKFDIEYWKFVRDNEIWNLPQKEDDILPAMELSYNQLPSYLKRCFACFSLFKKGTQFVNIRVTELWEALGFLPSPIKGQTMDDVGNQVLHDLLSRSFLQDYLEIGNFYLFKLHDLVHDLAFYVSKDEFQLVKLHDKNIFENVLHLSIIESAFLDQTPVPTGLRTIFLPKGANNKAFLYTLVSRCKFLRVLQIHDSMYESLPWSIGNLKHLRCLSLKNNKWKSLPHSVCKLQNLRTLKINGCINLKTLPNGIDNLISLRQLHITTNQSNFPNKEIAKLPSLEDLAIRDSDNLEDLFVGVQLPNLKSLTITYCDNLKSLPLHATPNLENLFIHGCWKLSLDHNNEMFNLKLKFLFLSGLPLLEHFPQWLQGCVNTLQALSVFNCPKLASFPDDDLHRFKNLKYLMIDDCPELKRRYHPKGGKDWHKISHIKQVIIERPSVTNQGLYEFSLFDSPLMNNQVINYEQRRMILEALSML